MMGMPEEESQASPGALPSGTIPRACDACRARKIRCNREVPCSHCLNAKIECTHQDVRPREKRTRILLTPQYEKKIDQIDRRLENVIHLIEDLRASMPSSSSGQHPQPVSQQQQRQRKQSFAVPDRLAARASVPNTSGVVSSSAGSSSSPSTSRGQVTGATASPILPLDPVVEGESSLVAHSIFANDFFQRVIDGNQTLHGKRIDMRETLATLHHIVDDLQGQPLAHELTYPHARPISRPPIEGRELPPIQKSAILLKMAKARQLPSITWIYEFLPMQKFPETCLNVYFSGEYSDTDFIVVNAGLYYMFLDFSNQTEDEAEHQESLEFSRLCRENLETSLANLPLHLPATTESIVALVIGANYAIEIPKPSLSWVLSAKASELCQTLGYHRLSVKNLKHTDEETRFRCFLFWSVYIVDKSLALRLGRAPTIQDRDIMIPLPSAEPPNPDPLIGFFRCWVLAAEIQGLIYDQLYCPEAVGLPESTRSMRVQDLATRLEELRIRMHETVTLWDSSTRRLLGDDMASFLMISDDVLRLSLLTLVHRAVPLPAGSPTTFSKECIEAARNTLARHQDCMAVVASSKLKLFATYMHWTILFAPFVPFIVLFCEVIETNNLKDLALLKEFIASIQSETPVSDAISKLNRLFNVLLTIASRYVETQSSANHTQPVPQVDADMENYLVSLGFPVPQPSTQQEQISNGGYVQDGMMSGQGTGQRVNPILWMGNGMQLEDWFFSNEHMMGFMEEPHLADPMHGGYDGSQG